MIARERPARPIGPVHPGRKPDNQEAGTRVTEWRHRQAVVIQVALPDIIEEAGQSRAGAAVPIENHNHALRPDFGSQYSGLKALLRIGHVADHCAPEAASPDQPGTGDEFLELLLDLLLVVNPGLAFRLANRRPQAREVEG